MSSRLLAAADNPPNAQSLLECAQLVVEGYNDQFPRSIPTQAVPNLRKIMDYPYPKAWLWEDAGDTICLVNGSTIGEDYVRTSLGYQAINGNAVTYVNSHFDNAATALFSAMPLQTKLIIGHSMGGAIGQIAARKLRTAFPGSAVRMVSFASPRWGGLAAAAGVSPEWCTEVSIETDPVKLIPGNGFAGRDWFRGGRKWSLNSNGRLVAAADQDISYAGTAAALNAQGTSQHSSLRYRDLLSVALLAAGNVPFDVYYVDP